MHFPFSKYHGTGNDFILADARHTPWEQRLDRAMIAALCHRRFGIGADGLILLQSSENADFRMVYYNSDGGESTFCGNGGRCVTAYAAAMGIQGPDFRFEAADGLHHASILPDGSVCLHMQQPQGFRRISAHAVWLNTGSPHYVQQVEQLADFDVVGEGRRIRMLPEFEPGGSNVNFVQPLPGGRLFVRTYERGVEDETLSCGTGVTACAYAWMMEHPEQANVQEIVTPGGVLTVRVEHAGSAAERVMLIGPAIRVFEGGADLASLKMPI